MRERKPCTLSGTAAAAPTDTLNPPASSSLAFAATPDGQLSAAQSVTITNSGGLPLTGIAVSISGQFQQTNNCGAQLAAGAVCTISVRFRSHADGRAYAARSPSPMPSKPRPYP